MKKQLVVTLAFLMLCGCSAGFQFSVMKQWDRPAERTITEDVMRTNSPKTKVETQDNVTVTPQAQPEPPVTAPAPPPAAPKAKPMSYDVPEMIVPKAAPIQYMYLHTHGDDKHACYVRKTVGVYAMKGE